MYARGERHKLEVVKVSWEEACALEACGVEVFCGRNRLGTVYKALLPMLEYANPMFDSYWIAANPSEE